MKIYQIHEFGGCYEDEYDYIVGTYLHKEKAEVKMEELNLREKELMKCNNCPLFFCDNNCDTECCETIECRDIRIKSTEEYCKRFMPKYDTKNETEIYCENYNCKSEESDFQILEEEVIE